MILKNILDIRNRKDFREWLKLFASRLQKLIEASGRGEMIDDWHDCGRLLRVCLLLA